MTDLISPKREVQCDTGKWKLLEIFLNKHIDKGYKIRVRHKFVDHDHYLRRVFCNKDCSLFCVPYVGSAFKLDFQEYNVFYNIGINDWIEIYWDDFESNIVEEEEETASDKVPKSNTNMPIWSEAQRWKHFVGYLNGLIAQGDMVAVCHRECPHNYCVNGWFYVVSSFRYSNTLDAFTFSAFGYFDIDFDSTTHQIIHKGKQLIKFVEIDPKEFGLDP